LLHCNSLQYSSTQQARGDSCLLHCNSLRSLLPPRKSTGLHRNPVDFSGLQIQFICIEYYTIFWDWTGLGLKGTPDDSRVIYRTGEESTGPEENPQDYPIILKYIYKSTHRVSNKIMYFVQLAGSGHMTSSHINNKSQGISLSLQHLQSPPPPSFPHHFDPYLSTMSGHKHNVT